MVPFTAYFAMLLALGADLPITARPMAEGFSSARDGTPVDRLVLHFSSNVVNDRKNPYDLDAVIAAYRSVPASVHYVIDRAGTVFRLVDEDRAAHHARALNQRSIGIELLAIGTTEDMSIYMTKEQYAEIPKEHLGYTPSQYDSLKTLIGEIRARHPRILHDRTHIVGHDEVDERKHDPGALFEWSKIGLAQEPTRE